MQARLMETNTGNPVRILCVCLGNICRSPMAEGAVRRAAESAGLPVHVDSAGTGAWHAGNPPDARGLAAAARRGYDNSAQRARQITSADFHDFDLILAMDVRNLADLQRAAPPAARARLDLFDPGRDVPDPYYGGPDGFETVLDQIEAAAGHWITQLRRDHI